MQPAGLGAKIPKARRLPGWELPIGSKFVCLAWLCHQERPLGEKWGDFSPPGEGDAGGDERGWFLPSATLPSGPVAEIPSEGPPASGAVGPARILSMWGEQGREDAACGWVLSTCGEGPQDQTRWTCFFMGRGCCRAAEGAILKPAPQASRRLAPEPPDGSSHRAPCCPGGGGGLAEGFGRQGRPCGSRYWS